MFVQGNTLGDVKSYYRKELQGLFSENEIKLILEDVSEIKLNISKIDFVMGASIKLSESELLIFHKILKRLKNEEPFQYILGECWFYDLNLKIDERALIPRPETEELVDWIVKDSNKVQELNILDLCSGSGCIALALKSILQDSNVSALEFSKEACSLIEENKQRTKLDVEIIESDALNIEQSSHRAIEKSNYDIWVSNPPYIPQKDRSLMAKNVLDHEPDMALFVEDDDALIFYREIASSALVYLNEGGSLYFEIHENLAGETVELLTRLGFVNIEVRKDLQNKDRMVKALKVSSQHESERG